jgi:adenine-specific DNA-methyltransferase
MSFTEFVQFSTEKYLKSVSKTERKAIGQFFTPAQIADFMGNMVTQNSEILNILDAGAGSGILSAAVLDKLKSSSCVRIINLDLYENNQNILPLLNENLKYIQKSLFCHGITLNYHIKDKNFISENHYCWTGLVPNSKYDIVISNPPYKKIGKNDLEAHIMNDIVYGQPNLYFLFMAMGAKLLKDNGEFVYIIPRSFSSGLYFTAFRKWFFSEMKITNMHLFISRDSVFNSDNVLQETIILKAIKSDNSPKCITITECADTNSFVNSTSFSVPYKACVKDDYNAFLFLPTSQNDIEVLDFIDQWNYTLQDAGYKMKTGVVVDFRETKWLRTESDNETIPLLWAYNLEKNKIEFPVYAEGKPQYLLASPDTARLQMNIANYILIKRFTSKEERKRLQCALLFKSDFADFRSVSTENHLNFITKVNGEMTTEEMYGLFVIINSIYMDKYFRILNGSTQVNANEINSIPFPSVADIIQLGKQAMPYQTLDEQICDRILEEKFM